MTAADVCVLQLDSVLRTELFISKGELQSALPNLTNCALSYVIVFLFDVMSMLLAILHDHPSGDAFMFKATTYTKLTYLYSKVVRG